jgi:tRNA A-37 threonylcarbamoyl transferase component Bud32
MTATNCTEDTYDVDPLAKTAPDAAEQLDFPLVNEIGLEELFYDSHQQQRVDDDFHTFTESAQSFEVAMETNEGTLVLTKGGMHNDDIDSSSSRLVIGKETTKGQVAGTTRNETGGATHGTTTTSGSDTNTTDASVFLPDKQQMPLRFVTAKDFDLLKVIGMGAFGKVLQVRHKHTQQILAMKVISKRLLRKGRGYVENVLAERKILTRVRSPFVVTMHCSFQTREKVFIIMDFLAGGEMFLRLGREGIFLEKEAAFYLGEIILALDHLHSLGILHRDLKPENILLGIDGHVCVTDFGLAKDFSDTGGFQTADDESRALTICGTQGR